MTAIFITIILTVLFVELFHDYERSKLITSSSILKEWNAPFVDRWAQQHGWELTRRGSVMADVRTIAGLRRRIGELVKANKCLSTTSA